jgi:primase-polymerase (primpol)-like protein
MASYPNPLLITLNTVSNFVVWNTHELDATGKQTKTPYSVASNGKMRASVTDPSTWATLQAAQTFISKNPQFQLG